MQIYVFLYLTSTGAGYQIIIIDNADKAIKRFKELHPNVKSYNIENMTKFFNDRGFIYQPNQSKEQ